MIGLVFLGPFPETLGDNERSGRGNEVWGQMSNYRRDRY